MFKENQLLKLVILMKMEFFEESYTGIAARIIQHEYDHIEGVLFTDHLNPFKRRLLKRELDDISKGKVDVDYKMKFQNLKDEI